MSSGQTASFGSRPQFTQEEQQAYIETLKAEKLQLSADNRLLKDELLALFRSGFKQRHDPPPVPQQQDNRRNPGNAHSDHRSSPGEANLDEELEIFFAGVPLAPQPHKFFSWLACPSEFPWVVCCNFSLRLWLFVFRSSRSARNGR